MPPYRGTGQAYHVRHDSLGIFSCRSNNEDVRGLMLLALYTGMRRGELFKLQWTHIDFDREFI